MNVCILSVSTNVRILKLVDRHIIGLKFLSFVFSDILARGQAVPSASHNGVLSGSPIISVFCFAKSS